MPDPQGPFEKLLHYQTRAAEYEPGRGSGEMKRGEWVGVIFRMADARVTCGIDHVHQFLPLPPITPVPGTKPWLMGLANVRGELMTVIDLPGFLSGKSSTATGRSRLLAATLRDRPLGLMVDEVFGQRHFVADDVGESTLAESSPLRPYVRQQRRSGKETWQELDLDILLRDPDFLNGAANREH
ncbi:MAG: chemotaxis protein CheW [Xanthomonadales bacterium]|nr:chemotaxis protein CheW [Xanthomonadales bacterium]NIN60353.1 chemotaxis protein CheW [Xanthomonadales bacterium]NIN75705.1 chemotaxis protein CheW [Xanthomonadales bacterium]NIO14778.1 chemotaxis protein CheW [Xanthomonadales bacterium]NIP12746.1 chemotaxis protein CheW [Xanthomonadales bacterium]